jgi:hypothetical protein
VVDSCEHGDETSDSTKRGELSDYYEGFSATRS